MDFKEYLSYKNVILYNFTKILNCNKLYRVLMGMPQGKKKGLSTKKFDRCVAKVKRKGGAKNPYAICNASMGGKSKSKSNGKGKGRL
jgi:hypothetical protein